MSKEEKIEMWEVLVKMLAIPFVVVFIFAILSFLSGSMDTANNRGLNNKSGCEYKSYASMYNPFYIAGCELFRDRTIKN